jgi:hypothetical protein
LQKGNQKPIYKVLKLFQKYYWGRVSCQVSISIDAKFIFIELCSVSEIKLLSFGNTQLTHTKSVKAAAAQRNSIVVFLLKKETEKERKERT